MKESVFHNKVIWFSFVFSLLVIWVHAYNAELFLGGTEWVEPVSRLEHWIGDGLAQVAVPGFFMISGYLFYRNFDLSRLREKWNRRIRSVLVPYILWNFLYYLGYVAGSRLPWMRDVMDKDPVPFRLDMIVDAVINYRYNYVFWYLFQLILLIILAPVLYRMLDGRRSRICFFAVLAVVLWLDIRLPLLNTDALCYYAAAATLALTGRDWVERCRGNILAGAVLLAAAAVVYNLGLRFAMPVGFVLCRLLAVSGLWTAVPGERLPKAASFMENNFFLYATHFGLVRFINKAAAEQFGAAAAAVPVVLYLLMPGIVLLVCSITARIMRRYTPGVWALLNGGR